MNIVNVLLIFMVLIIGGILVVYMVRKNKNAEVDELSITETKSYS